MSVGTGQRVRRCTTPTFSSARVPLVCLAAVLAASALACRHTSPRPNVVLIVIDTLRADHLGCYGYPRATSPYLDSFAHRGVRFANARATSSWTLPTVASILTGL